MTDSSPHRPPPICVEDDAPRDEFTSAIAEPVANIEGIRESVDELAGSDKLDKDSALAMTRLFHSMETLMRNECTRRDVQISRLEYELERMRIQYELDRITNVQIHQQNQVVESAQLRRAKSKW